MNRIKETRERKGVKQITLANACGVSQSSFSNWECGRHQPSLDKLSVIAEMLDVSTDYLLGLSDKENPEKRDTSLVAETDEIHERLRRNPSLYALLDAVKDMPEHDLNRVVKIIRIMLDTE